MSKRRHPSSSFPVDTKMHSNPFSKASRNSVPLPRNRELRPLKQDPGATIPVHSHLTDNMMNQSIDQSTMFNDPAQVQQWVTSSATGPVRHDDPCLSSPSRKGSYGVFQSPAEYCATLQDPGVLHVDVPLQFPYGSEPYDDCFNVDAFAIGAYPSLVSEPPFVTNDAPSSGLAYDIPGSADMVYTTSTNSIFFADDFCASAEGLNRLDSLTQDGANFQVGFSGAHAWPSPSGASLNPSLPSSYSHGGLFPYQGNSPVSFATEDSSSNASINDEGFLPPPTVDCPVQNPFVNTSNDSLQFDMTSTITASNGFARAPLSENTFWPQYQLADVISPGIPLDIYMSRRASEHDNSSARRNELYQLGPKEDRLYHCPFEVSDGCRHKPEKLKCNYDKHLDSHLKPYRCKVPACGSVPFSSTACLLRHEREAHGMHGHGDRPYMCSYPDCDRSLQGNGFPRRWNLMDHMKRVHDHQVAPMNGRDSPTLSDNTKLSRRRRTSTCSQPAPSRITKNNGKNAGAVRQKTTQRQNLAY